MSVDAALVSAAGALVEAAGAFVEAVSAAGFFSAFAGGSCAMTGTIKNAAKTTSNKPIPKGYVLVPLPLGEGKGEGNSDRRLASESCLSTGRGNQRWSSDGLASLNISVRESGSEFMVKIPYFGKSDSPPIPE